MIRGYIWPVVRLIQMKDFLLGCLMRPAWEPEETSLWHAQVCYQNTSRSDISAEEDLTFARARDATFEVPTGSAEGVQRGRSSLPAPRRGHSSRRSLLQPQEGGCSRCHGMLGSPPSRATETQPETIVCLPSFPDTTAKATLETTS